MSWVLFSVGLLFVFAAYNSHFSMRRPGIIVLQAWISAWLLSELPVHFMVAAVAIGGTLAALGGLEAWPGYVGLALCGAAALALVPHMVLARGVADVVENALKKGLGDNYADEHSLPVDEWAASAWRYVTVLPIRQPGVSRVRNIVYHKAKGKDLKLDIFKPETPLGNRPVALYVHGGGWVIGNKKQQGLMSMNALAARGWVGVSINYRLSPSATFPDHLLDVKRAIKWVKENIAEHGGDPNFIVIMGGSAGAHLAALAALTPNDLEFQREFPNVDTSVQGCVGYYGVYDFTDRDGQWPHNMFRLVILERMVMKRRFKDAEEEYRKASPIHRVTADAPPFFLVHGDRDSLAPVDESRALQRELLGASKEPVVYAEIPGANHAFEIFPSVRSAAAVDGVARFCDHIHARHVAAKREAG